MYRNSHQLSQWLTSASEKPAFLQHYVYHDLYPAWLAVFVTWFFVFGLFDLTRSCLLNTQKNIRKNHQLCRLYMYDLHWFLPLCKTKLIIYNNSHFIIQCSTLKKKICHSMQLTPSSSPPPRLKILGLLALLLAAKNVSPGGTSAPQRQKFHTDDVKSVQNLVSRSDWSI